MSDLVTIDVKDHVADVRLNRPEKMNALSPDPWIAIHEAGDATTRKRLARPTHYRSAPVRCPAWL